MYRSNFRECLYYVLRKWKTILAVALVLGCGLAGIKCAKIIKNWDKDTVELTEANEIYEAASKSHEESVAQYEAMIANLDSEIAAYNDKLADLDFLYYDATQIGFSTSSFSIQSTNILPDGTTEKLPGDFFQVLIYSLKMNIDWDEITAINGIDERYVQTFCRLTSDDNRQILYVSCIAETEEIANQINDIIDEYILSNDMESMSNYAPYTINRFYSMSKTEPNNIYDEIVTNVRTEGINLTQTRDAKQEELDSFEAPVKPNPLPSVGGTIKTASKHLLFGFVAGGGFMVLCYYVLYYLNGRMHSEEEYQFYTDSYTYAYIPKCRKPLKGISSFIARKESRDLLYTQEEAISRVIANIKSQGGDIKSVLFTGCSSEKEVMALEETLKAVKESGLKCGVDKSILTDKKAFDNLKNYDAIVLVEKIDKTQIAIIKKEIDQIKQAGKEIACCLMCR